MPFAMTLGLFREWLTFERRSSAPTINAAYSLDRHHLVGSLEPGKQMDASVVDGSCRPICPDDGAAFRADPEDDRGPVHDDRVHLLARLEAADQVMPIARVGSG